MSSNRTDIVRKSTIHTLPVTMFGEYDSVPLHLIPQRELSVDLLKQRLHVDSELAKHALEAVTATHLFAERSEALEEYRRLRANSYREKEAPLHIVDVQSDGPVLSARPFELTIHYQNGSDNRVVLASVTVSWVGEPFIIQQCVSPKKQADAVTITFDEKHSLPVGQAEFLVTLYREDGAASTFRRNVYVLPSNPLSLALGPAGGAGDRELERAGRLSAVQRHLPYPGRDHAGQWRWHACGDESECKLS